MIQPNTPAAYELIHKGLLAFSAATNQGMRIDEKYCKKTDKILKMKIKRLKSDFLDSETGKLWADLHPTPNINSDKQLRNVLYDHKDGLKLEIKKTTDKGNPSVDNEVLDIYGKDIPELKGYKQYKKLYKVKHTYIEGIIKETVNGILRPNFNLHPVVTFRSSSNAINFQNQPNRDPESKKLVRQAFIPRPGHHLMSADFSGIEVGISCCYHHDPKMIDYVKYPQKNNMHTDMAIQCYMLDQFQKSGAEKTLRKGTKNGFVFPQFYGDYYRNNAVSLANWAKLPTSGRFRANQGLELMSGMTVGEHFLSKGLRNYKDFENHIKDTEDDFWNNRFKKYGKWKKINVKQYYKHGHLNFHTGFTCSGVNGKNNINNYPIQGSAFHCLLFTFIKLDQEIRERNLKSRLIGQIHDELVLDAHPSEVETLKSLIRWIACEWLPEQWKWIIIPLEVEASVIGVDQNWAQDAEVTVLRAA